MIEYTFDISETKSWFDYCGDDDQGNVFDRIRGELIDTYPQAKNALLHDEEWADVEDNLSEFSEKYPDLILKLSGAGEERLDIWELYAKNGEIEMCRAQIYIPIPDWLENLND